MNGNLKVGGTFEFAIRRNGKIIDRWSCDNLVVNEGLDYLLDTALSGGTAHSTWYVGIFSGNVTPASTWTAANVTANATESTAYDETTRVQWIEVGASGQSITNSASRATFTMNSTVTIYGAFLVSASAKSATTGTLFSAALFSAPRSLISADELLVTYTIGASSS